MKSLSIWKEVTTLTGVILMFLFVMAATADNRNTESGALSQEQAEVPAAIVGEADKTGHGFTEAIASPGIVVKP